MSAIDEAFIRAYQSERAAAGAPQAAGAPVDRAVKQPLTMRNSPGQAWSGLAPNSRVGERSAPASKESAKATGNAPTVARRPLSEFARPAQAPQQQFKPALEVDRFRWSPVSETLVRHHAGRLDNLVSTLMAADDAGRSLIGIAGMTRGVGCTTLVACAARLLVDAGKTVAIVDGNFAAPGLASALGLPIQAGWENVLAGGAPLAEAVVHSIGDQLAVLPLARGGAALAEKLDSIQASVTAGVLRYHYNIVLVDLGALDNPGQAGVACKIAKQCRLDAVILTSGRNQLSSISRQRLGQIAPDLAKLCLGQVKIAA
jgi:Mrp family chromosome partitioning ATPase